MTLWGHAEKNETQSNFDSWVQPQNVTHPTGRKSVREPWKVVIVGGGFGGLCAAQGLMSRSVDVTLIDCHNSGSDLQSWSTTDYRLRSH